MDKKSLYRIYVIATVFTYFNLTLFGGAYFSLDVPLEVLLKTLAKTSPIALVTAILAAYVQIKLTPKKEEQSKI